MVRKMMFISRCTFALGHYFPETTAITTINTMKETKLKDKGDMDEVSDEVANEIITIIYERIAMLNGNSDAISFLHEMEKGVT
jgi:hypothetical protein